MYLECVIVCVNFSDVLAHTLPLNKNHFDKIVVVTDTGDKATWSVCRHHHVQCISTDEFYHQDQAFNKGKGINAGLRQLKKSDWILHMDADIVLPVRTRELLQKIKLDPTVIYGVDRMMCPSFEDWIKHVTQPSCQHPDEIFVVPEPFPMGARVAKLDGEGYVPIGYFQLWHGRSGQDNTYPIEHGTAGRGDMLHALKWSRDKRALIPELIAIHLEGPQIPHQRNWRGRTMGSFGPVQVPVSVNPQLYR